MRQTERRDALTEAEHAREHARASARIQQLEAERDALEARLKRVESSIIWQAAQALKRRVGEDSRAARAAGATLRGAAKLSRRRAALVQAAVPVVELPSFSEPALSLILPVHSQPELTVACVRAIARTAPVPYELIIVDDTATPAVKQVVRRIAGATVAVNERNLGYTASLNRGAALARGEFLVFLNDDTEPEPGWLEAMLDCARSAADVGVVVPMYLDPDGRLKEAGSIVWRDGEAENFGRGDTCPDRSRYRYRRDVDYGSGACLLVRADLLRAIGGLDERFSPAYYEDVDLCFAAREAGARVVYEPRARVRHVEGATAGTDVSAGNKRFQVVNRDPFMAKWRHRLELQPRRGGDSRFASVHAGGPHVLIADEAVPTPDRDGGSRRMWRLIHAFRELGCAVTFLPADGRTDEPYAGRLEAAGVEVLRRPADVDAELAALGPGLVLAVLSRPQVAARCVYRLREVAPGARIVYDTVDLHHRRELRRSYVEHFPASPRVDALRELELAMVRCCDLTLAASEEERDEIQRLVPDAAVEVIATIEDLVEPPAPIGDRHGVVFVGGFRHAPNVDAACFLARSVMPEVWRERPDARLTIVGQEPPAEVQALSGPRVSVTGWVDDLAPVLAGARVAVAPIRFGAGVQIKAIEAMAHGVPVVSTTLAASGLGALDGVHLLVGDEPGDHALRIRALLDDDALWQRLSRGGRALVAERYAPHVVEPRLRRLLVQDAAAQPSR